MDNATKYLPFNLDAARDGAPIAMANGQTAEFVAFCERAIFPLVVLTGPNNVIDASFRADGTSAGSDDFNLVMVVSVENRYVNLFSVSDGAVHGVAEHYATEAQAIKEASDWVDKGGTPMLAIAVPVEVRVK
ncbi:hypothetical protein [Paraburkholderia domus]|uniref:hypothetical protein n=1 Tax=Paraburkholderia domus TaxID=2793075 RepID=UPI001914CB43|nr:hypothetical protein [Paraburkholderia domus]MBK5061734.1 hypothetical protein [Burkholderia sp. R-70199]CAE6899478.1 hypothetical protein R70199_03607 [Paraburkholderia domus]